MNEPPDLHPPLSRYPWIIVRPRSAEVRLAALAARYGHRIAVREVLHAFMADCPWTPHSPHRKSKKHTMRCGAFMPDLNPTRPPDIPPTMAGLSLIEGGKVDVLPGEPACTRRRVGRDE